MRLMESILKEGIVPMVGHPEMATIVKTMSMANKILADNVVKYYYEVSRKEFWHLQDDFPNLAPPFQNVWIETHRPDRIVSDAMGVSSNEPLPVAWGALGVSFENELLDKSLETLGLAGKRMDGLAPRIIETWKNSDIRWITLWSLYGRGKNMVVVGPLGYCCMAIQRDGSVPMIQGTDQPAVLVMPTVQKDDPVEKAEALANECVQLLKPLLLTLCFMHCRNVEMVEHQRPEKLQRKFEKRGDARATVKYKTLVIEPMRRVLDQEGGAEANGLSHAMAICRGHFKDYRASGLFGRHKGIYWWDQQVRGTQEAGEIVKQYDVRTGHESGQS